MTVQVGTSRIPHVPAVTLFRRGKEVQESPHRFFVDMYRELGPVFEIGLLNTPYIVLAGYDANLFFKQRGHQYLNPPNPWEALTNSEADDHAYMSPALRREAKRDVSEKIDSAQLTRTVDFIEQILGRLQEGSRLELVLFMQRLFYELLGDLFFDQANLDDFEAMKYFITAHLNVSLTHTWPRWVLKLPRYRRDAGRVMTVAEDLVNSERKTAWIQHFVHIKEHLAAYEYPLDVLMPYLVGLHTLAHTAAFLFYSILTYEGAYERLKGEIAQVLATGPLSSKSMQNMPVLDGIMLENYRLHPVAGMALRTVTTPFEFAGYNISRGRQVIIATSVTHLLEDYFPNPYILDIDRYRNNTQALHHVLIPFGSGAHKCLGADLAEMLMRLLTITLLDAFELRLEPPGANLKLTVDVTPRPAAAYHVRLLKRRH